VVKSIILDEEDEITTTEGLACFIYVFKLITLPDPRIPRYTANFFLLFALLRLSTLIPPFELILSEESDESSFFLSYVVDR